MDNEIAYIIDKGYGDDLFDDKVMSLTDTV